MKRWGGKLRFPQRVELASEGSSAATTKQEFGTISGLRLLVH
ncbi:MAG: hypothetical protein WCS19_04510 [Candidatus Cloacimonadaceae bacterium]